MVLQLIKYFSIIFLSCASQYYDYIDYIDPNRAQPTLKSIEYKPDGAKESQIGLAATIAENAVTNNCRN